MRKHISAVGTFAFVMCCALCLHAQTVVTFDEVDAWNNTPAGGGIWVGEEFSAKGVHFLGNYYFMVGSNHFDGVVYDDGMLYGVPSADGSQYLGLAGTHPDGGIGNLGMILQFDQYQTSISFDAYGMNGAGVQYWVFDTAVGTSLGSDLYGNQWSAPAGTWGEVIIGDGSVPFNYVLIAGAFAPGNQYYAIDNLTFVGTEMDPAPTFTGIQIISMASNIETNVRVGDTVFFTVAAITDPTVGTINYRFFARNGYGLTDWGGFKWSLKQGWSPSDSASITFDTPGRCFVSVHLSETEHWEFGDPQTGMAVEVAPGE